MPLDMPSMSISIPEGMSISMVGISKGMSITIVGISSGLGSRSWLGISGPLAIISVSISMVGISYSMTITMTISMAIISTKTMAISISMVAIVGTCISTGFSLTGSSGEQREGNNSNGFHHFECLQARGFSYTSIKFSCRKRGWNRLNCIPSTIK